MATSNTVKKKRKSDDMEVTPKESTPPIQRLKDWYNQFTLVGRAAIITKLQEDPEFRHRLLAASHQKDIRSFGQDLVLTPSAQSNLTIIRDPKDKRTIIKILDVENKLMLEGPKLERMIGAGMATRREIGAVLFLGDETSSRKYEALVVPDMNLVPHKDSFTRTSDNVKIEWEGARIIKRGTTRLSAITLKATEFLVKLETLPMSQFPSVLSALSNVFEKDPDFNFSSYHTLEAIETGREEESSKKAHKAYFDSLEAAFLCEATYESRVAAFAKNPTFAYASKLGFLRPYDGKLLDAQGKQVQPKKLSEVQSEVGIILQNLPVDANYFKTGFKPEMPVYPQGPKYFIKAKGARAKLTPYKVHDTITAAQLRQVVASIETATSEPKEATVTDQENQLLDTTDFKSA